MLCSSDSAVVLSDENSSAELTVLCSRSSTVFGETEILSVTSFPYQNHRVWGIIMFIY